MYYPKTLILLALSLINFWIWKIISVNAALGLTLIVLSILLGVTLSTKSRQSLIILTIALTLAVSFYNLRYGFDRTVFTKEPVEILLQQTRHGYLSVDLGKLFNNKISLQYYSKLSLPLAKLQRNAFSALDLNLYFFASHPREKKGIDDFEKYSFILLPVFFAGIFYILRKGHLILGAYFLISLSVNAFISASYPLGPILFFPLINVVLAEGAIVFLNKLKSYFNLNYEF